MNVVDEKLNRAINEVTTARHNHEKAVLAEEQAETAERKTHTALRNAQNKLGAMLAENGLVGGDYELTKPDHSVAAA